MGPAENPIFTRAIDIPGVLASGICRLIVGSSEEDRSFVLQSVRDSAPELLLEIVEVDDINLAQVNDRVISLRNPTEVRALLGDGPVGIDITGLSHHVWAPLIKASWSCDFSVHAFYVEPADYARSTVPTEGSLFDLSERIRGISPLPGFSAIGDSIAPEDSLFVPLLGFEGARLAHIVESTEPERDNFFPVVGVPGFQPAFPFYSYLGNQTVLSDTMFWRNAHFARANCPFSLFYCLQQIRKSRPSRHMTIVPIGTKPHGLGAVLFHVSGTKDVEMVYDHPIRKPQRTSGYGTILSYDLSGFREFLENEAVV